VQIPDAVRQVVPSGHRPHHAAPPGDGSPTDASTTPDSSGFRRVIVGVEHPYIAGGLAMDATGIGTGHNDSFVYQARAFLDEIASLDELPRNASFADGLHNLLVQEAVVRSATQTNRTPVTA
jgi:predicted dehydrogenase